MKSWFEQSVKQGILQTSTRRSWPVSLTEGCQPVYNPPSHGCWLPTWGFTGGENQLIWWTTCSKGSYSSNTLGKSGTRVLTQRLTPLGDIWRTQSWTAIFLFFLNLYIIFFPNGFNSVNNLILTFLLLKTLYLKFSQISLG